MKLEKANEAGRAAKEAAEVAEQAFYNLGVQETEVRLVQELTEICRDYCYEVWTKALNLVEVTAALEWTKVENIYYPPDICEVPAALLSPTALAPISSEQPSIT